MIFCVEKMGEKKSRKPNKNRPWGKKKPRPGAGGWFIRAGWPRGAAPRGRGGRWVDAGYWQPILCGRHRQLTSGGQLVHPQDEPSRFFGTAAAGALAVVDIAQRPEQDAFVGTVEFNFTFQFFLQCQLYIGKRLRFALKAIQLKKFQK